MKRQAKNISLMRIWLQIIKIRRVNRKRRDNQLLIKEEAVITVAINPECLNNENHKAIMMKKNSEQMTYHLISKTTKELTLEKDLKKIELEIP